MNMGPNGSYVCGHPEADVKSRLAAVASAGEKMLTDGASAGAYDPKTKRNVLLMQHYPNTCQTIAGAFAKAAPESSAMLDVHCVFGHAHSTECEKGVGSGTARSTGNKSSMINTQNLSLWDDVSSATAAAGDCHWAQLGAGGGCCQNERVEKGYAGFGVLYFLPDGSMRIEQVTSGKACSIMKSETPHPSPPTPPSPPSPPVPPSPSPPPPVPAQDSLNAGETLAAGKHLISNNSNVRLEMQKADGNLVLRASGKALWSSKSAGHPGSYLRFQRSDGNLVLYDPNMKPTWSSGNHKGAVTLKLQDDCDLVVRDNNQAMLWSTGTSCKKGMGGM